MIQKIPVVFCINNSYVKQLATVIVSILQNSDKNNCFDFIIFNKDITDKNKKLLLSLKSFNKNITLRFVDLTKTLKDFNLENFMSRRENYTYISTETYFRFFIPELITEYDKVIYLDSDILVLDDLAKLYNEDITEFCAGVIQDTILEVFWENTSIKTKIPPEQSYPVYFRKKLRKKENKYFNAGVLLLNLKKFRDNNITQKLWEFTAQESPLEFQDQDVLNAVLEQQVKYLDYKWNVLKDSNKFNLQMRDKIKGQQLSKVYNNPAIFHYVGSNKPWQTENKHFNYKFIHEWWEYFKETPFYKNEDLKIYAKIKNILLFQKFKNICQWIFQISNELGNKYIKFLGFKIRLRKHKEIKAALLIDEFFGGANTAFGGYGFLARKYICKYIPDENIKIDVLLERVKGLKTAKYEIVDNVKVYRLPMKGHLAKRWLKKQNYDLFISIEMTYPSYDIMRLVDKKKLLLWVQDPRPNTCWEEKRKSMSVIQDPCVCDENVSKLIKKLYVQNRVKFISQGYSLIPLAKELYNLPDNCSMDYVPNPIDIDYNFKFDISQKKKQIIFLGRLEAQKRAWIFCEVAKRMPEYEFYVLGKFFRYEDENKKILQPYLNNNVSNLHFVGHLDGGEKEKFLRESRVLLNTSIWEGIPISWLEAMQYGTAIVSCLNNEEIPSRFGTYVGEIPGDGFDKVELFLPAIKRLTEDDEFYKEKAIAGIEHIRKEHDVDIFHNNFMKYIDKVQRLNL